MTSDVTHVFVDVDGVINAIPDRDGDLTAWPEHTWQRQSIFLPSVGRGSLIWSTAVIDRLRDIESRPGVEMTWCTTWQEMVFDHLCPRIGIGADWPVAMDGAEVRDGPLDWWKATSVRRVLRQPNHRAIWIDDDIDTWRTAQLTAGLEENLTWLDYRVLTICPDTRTGLTPTHLDQIEAFLC